MYLHTYFTYSVGHASLFHRITDTNVHTEQRFCYSTRKTRHKISVDIRIFTVSVGGVRGDGQLTIWSRERPVRCE